MRNALQDGVNTRDNPLYTIKIDNLVPFQYDNIELTYVAAGNGVGEIETVTYKDGSTTVSTLTLTYNADNKIISVVRS